MEPAVGFGRELVYRILFLINSGRVLLSGSAVPWLWVQTAIEEVADIGKPCAALLQGNESVCLAGLKCGQ